MKIRMLTVARGAINADPDEVIDVDGATALALIEGGYAEPEDQRSSIEAAVVEQTETAAVATRRHRGRRYAARE